MHFPEFRSSNTARKRTAAAALVAIALVGGVTAVNSQAKAAAPATAATAAASTNPANCQVVNLKTPFKDPNTGNTFPSLSYCDTAGADLFPVPSSGDTTAFGELNAGRNYIVCWSSEYSKSTNGYYWMLTEGDKAKPGKEKQFDLDYDKPAAQNVPDASADRMGWVSSQILGIKAGEKPVNIAECGEATKATKTPAGGTNATNASKTTSAAPTVADLDAQTKRVADASKAFDSARGIENRIAAAEKYRTEVTAWNTTAQKMTRNFTLPQKEALKTAHEKVKSAEANVDKTVAAAEKAAVGQAQAEAQLDVYDAFVAYRASFTEFKKNYDTFVKEQTKANGWA